MSSHLAEALALSVLVICLTTCQIVVDGRKHEIEMKQMECVNDD